MSKISNLSPYARPPASIKTTYKFYQKLTLEALKTNPNIIDFQSSPEDLQHHRLKQISSVSCDLINSQCAEFDGDFAKANHVTNNDVPVYEHADLPGLHFFPELFPPSLQRTLLSRLLHEYLANPDNKTNVHLHHHVSYDLTGSAESPSLGLYNSYESSKLEPRSFFHLSPQSFLAFQPIDPAVHRPIAISQFLNSKLRWLTLGSQYDWTRKLYPADNTPQFPGSLAKLTTSFFPNLQPEAAIVNVYTPGDTLGIHRDVSEESDNGLVSVSLGCDGVFLAGLEFLDGSIKHVVVRLRSGDAVYMSGKARFAWHGIPQILSGTCPSWLKDWPASLDAGNPEANRTNDFEPWRGWMASKRVNLNIRQVRI